jgi:hypothetical protein
MGVAETIALAGLGLTGIGMVGAGMSSAIKALWSISKGLGAFEGKILQILERHDQAIADHEDRLRGVEGLIK